MKKYQTREIELRIAETRFRKKIRRKKLKNKQIRKREKNRRQISKVQKARNKLKNKADKNKYIKLKPPNRFSIIGNSNETIEFFEKVRSAMSKYEPVFVDMADIEYMTVDALVYYIAVIQKQKALLKAWHVRGTFPTNKKVLRLMERSGFLNYAETDKKSIKTDKHFIEIKIGNLADYSVVKDICQFVMNRLSVSRIDTQRLYGIVFEMMLNTKHHAYSSFKQNYDNWILFMQFFPEKKSIDFIFMDTGYGIPNTVRKNKMETVRKWFSQLSITDFNEGDLVYSALQGAYRTKTKEGYRGKGLPCIYKAYTEGYLRDLNILSNKACINNKQRGNMETEMIGTLFFWKISKESIHENTKN